MDHEQSLASLDSPPIARPDELAPENSNRRGHLVAWGMFCVAGGIVTLLIGLVVAATVFVFFFDRTGSKDHDWQGTKVTLSQIQTALIMYKLNDAGEYPASLSELHSAKYFPSGVPTCPYTKANFLYKRTPDGFTLTCLGKDRWPGGAEPPEKDIIFNESGEVR
ncbi:MAG: hypothetical protein IPK87_02670 [Planctomycetes bacterium]|nr:hypothetical protein [Planctomycetota bacterium]